MGLFSFLSGYSGDVDSAILRDPTISGCVVTQENAGKKVYNNDEAICYISKVLRAEPVTKEEIRHVVDLQQKFWEEGSHGHDENALLGYVRDNQTIGLSKKKIDQIYDADTYYLRFIGAADF